MKKINRNGYCIVCFLVILFSFLSLKGVKTSDISFNQDSLTLESSVESVKITVLIDNYPNSTLNSPWGLSILVETPNSTILFDTGPDPIALQENAEKLGVDLSQLDLVIISHGHADHVEGLSHVADQNPNITVFVPVDMSSQVKQRISSWNVTMVEVETNLMIKNHIAIIGPLYGPPSEQAVAINVEKLGLIILVGCSHPGVDNLVKEAKDYYDTQPYAVIGGFHLFDKTQEEIIIVVEELLKTNIKRIFPCHCSGDAIRNYLQTNHPSYYEELTVGYSTTFRGDLDASSSSQTSSSASSSSKIEILYVIGGFIMIILFTWRKRRD